MDFDGIIKDLKNRWQTASRKTIFNYAEEFPGVVKASAANLIGIMTVEISLRENDGDQPHPEDYVDAFPEYAVPIFGLFEVGPGLGTTAFGGPSGDDGFELRPSLPTYLNVFGRLTLIEELHAGRMSTVYRGEQFFGTQAKRSVVVKVTHGDSEEEENRFRREAELLARVSHPNIVPIFYWGKDQGRHWFTMQHVSGKDLATMVEDGPLDPRRAARYMKIVSETIHHAHENGVLHRDIKPSNIMVERKTGWLYVMDFGLGKVTESRNESEAVSVLCGTPEYMSPEMAVGGPVSRRTEVYGLGATLFHLLVGRPPYRGETIAAILDQVENEPIEQVFEAISHGPGGINLDLDLKGICLKCLQKDPAARYGTAQEVADDLGRFLAGKPVQARPVTSPLRFGKWVKRRPAEAFPWGLVLLLLMVSGGALAEVFYGGPSQPNVAALTPNEPFEAGRPTLDPKDVAPKWQRSGAVSDLAVRNAIKSDDRVLVLGLGDQARLWAMSDPVGSNLLSPDLASKSFTLARFSPDGRKIIWASEAGAVWLLQNRSSAPIQMLGRESGMSTPLCLRFAPQGDWFALGFENGWVEVRNTQDATFVKRFQVHNSKVLAIGFAGGSRILSAAQEGSVRLSDWALETENLVATWPQQQRVVHSMVAVPASQLFLAGADDGSVSLWVGSGVEKSMKKGHKLEVDFLATFTNGDMALSACKRDGSARLWYTDSDSLEPGISITGKSSPIECIAVARSGRRIVCGEEDGWTTVWNEWGNPIARLHQVGETGPIRAVAVSDDGRWVVTGSDEGKIALYGIE